MSQEESIGYGQPPRSTRFRKGQSGNPRGRPKNRHRDIPYDAVLGQMVTMRENGKERRVTAAEAFLLQLTQKGLTGDRSAAREKPFRLAPSRVADAVKSVHAAIEIVDSRIADWKIAFADTVADNGSSAFFILANAGQDLDGLDLEGAKMEMSVDGEVVSTGVGSAALGNPLNAAAWLARTLASGDEPLKAGDILLAGALGPTITLKPGDAVCAEIAGIGRCGFTFGRA